MTNTTPDPAVAGEGARPGATAVLVVAVGAMVMLPAAVTGTNVAFPEIEAEFGASRAVLSWILSGYAIATAACTLLGGQLSDRLGARRMFFGGMIAFAAGSFVSAAAPVVGVLIAGRVLQGIGAAVFVPASLAMVLPQYPRSRHPFVIGVWAAAVPIGSSLSPTLTALGLELGSWRWVFAAQLVVAVVLVAVGVRQDADSERQGEGSQPDYLGVVVGTAAFALLALAIVQGPRWGWGSAGVVGSFVAVVVLMPLFLARTRSMPQPLLDLDLFSISSFRVANIVSLGVSMVGSSVWLLWPIHLASVWGYSDFEIGLAITPTPLMAGLFSLRSSVWIERYGYRNLLLVGTGLMTLGNLWFVFFYGAEPAWVTRMLPGLVLYGIAMGLSFAPLNGGALTDVSEQAFGRANAAFLTGRALAGAIGVAILIAILGDASGVEALDEFDRAFWFLSGVSAVSFVAVVAIWPRREAAPAG